MAIKSYVSETGKVLFQVYRNVRSKSDPNIRVQRRISGIKTEKEASKEDIRLLRELEREVSQKEAKGSTWKAVVDSWELHLRKEGTLGESTRLDYIAALRKHCHSWWHRPAVQITKFDVRELLNQLKAQGCSHSYQNRIKIIVNRAFIYGMESGLIRSMERSPAYGIKLGRGEEKKPEILTIAEIRNLLLYSRRLDHQWYPIWATALLTGMRNGELYALLWTDIDWDNNIITVTKSFNKRRRETKSTKSGYWRSVPISTELKSLSERSNCKLAIESVFCREFVLGDLATKRESYECFAKDRDCHRLSSTR